MSRSRRTVSVLLYLLAIASTAVAAAARADTPAGLKRLGVRVSADPVVSEAKGELYTTSIVWRVRTIYADANGAELSVWLHDGERLVDDVTRNVKSAWTREHMRFERTFASRAEALRAFRYWSQFNDVRIAYREIPDDGGKPLPGLEPIPKPRTKTCREAMIDAGHSASHLGYCTKDIPDWCAVAILEKKHPAVWVGYCRGNLERKCAEKLIERGESPSRLAYCSK